MLLTHHESGGYKPTIRARASLIPIRDISREMEYESITNAQRKEPNAPLDFIDTLWNNRKCITNDLLKFISAYRLLSL